MTLGSLKPAVTAALVVVITAGIYLGSTLQRASADLVASQLDVAASLSTLATAAAELGAAQEAYVAPGQPDAPWLQRVSELSQQITDGSMSIRSSLRSTEAADQLNALSGHLQTFLAIDGRIRVNLQNGQDLSASDLIFTDARDTVMAIVSTLQALAQNERAAGDAERAAIAQQGWLLIGLVTVLVAAGLFVLFRPAAGSLLEAARSTAGARLEEGQQSAGSMVEPATPAPAPAVDLDAAAAICTDISRLTSASALPDLLARAAVVLDAAGIILWMGAGEELFAVTAHGYDAKVLSRLGPIGRHANNATAAAWRNGQLSTVPGDMMANGAIVAPMFGIDGCIGVLAAEVRHGRETDASTASVTALFAAQLATIVSAWPAPSEAPAAADSDSGPLAASL